MTATNCDSTQCNYTYYPAVGSRSEFGVSVEVAGCVTTSTVCLERPVCELRAKKMKLIQHCSKKGYFCT